MVSSTGACGAWKDLKWLNGLHEQQANFRVFLLLGKVMMETFQVVWSACDKEIVFKVSEWHHRFKDGSELLKGDPCGVACNITTWTVADHQTVKVIVAKGGILVDYCCVNLSKHMEMFCISQHIAPRVLTWE
jgi:hypothetical protein